MSRTPDFTGIPTDAVIADCGGNGSVPDDLHTSTRMHGYFSSVMLFRLSLLMWNRKVN